METAKRIEAFLKDKRGVTAIEYALIASLIFLVIVGAVGAMAQQVTNLYQQIAAAL